MRSAKEARFSLKLLCWVCTVWIGLLFAIDLDSALRMQITSISHIQAIDVSRHAFAHIMQLQWIAVICLWFLAYLSRPRGLNRYCIIVISVLFLCQSLIIFPQLSARVDLLQNHLPLQPSMLHAAYGLAEVIKFICLIILSLNLLRIN